MLVSCLTGCFWLLLDFGLIDLFVLTLGLYLMCLIVLRADYGFVCLIWVFWLWVMVACYLG